MPAFVLHKRIIGPEVHAHRLTADRTARNQLRGNRHFKGYTCRNSQCAVFLNGKALGKYHLAHGLFIVIGLVVTGLAALPEAVIALRVEEPVLIESGLLEAMIHIGRQDKIVFILYELEQLLINRLSIALWASMRR